MKFAIRCCSCLDGLSGYHAAILCNNVHDDRPSSALRGGQDDVGDDDDGDCELLPPAIFVDPRTVLLFLFVPLLLLSPSPPALYPVFIRSFAIFNASWISSQAGRSQSIGFILVET